VLKLTSLIADTTFMVRPISLHNFLNCLNRLFFRTHPDNPPKSSVVSSKWGVRQPLKVALRFGSLHMRDYCVSLCEGYAIALLHEPAADADE
jgi:hypothetical protein